MLNWINEPPLRPRQAKSSGRSASSSKNVSRSSENRAKYARHTQGDFALLVHATSASLALGIDNSRSIRALKGQVVPSMLVPRHKALDEAAAVEVDDDMPWDAECKAYGRLAHYFSAEPKIPQHLRKP
eukprot:TRINITY_DN62010_c0_g1_i1.p1 TRINITY_DN62010_c0_g1~~TRINITY_DN62010_c0_g1_i1.p1  ORF type:complete len:128 (-),score=14.13 TRINITY_DN62010_c0_g1_i1:391-774(-)